MPITADIREGTVYQYFKRQIENDILNSKKEIENKVLKNVALSMYKAGDTIEFISSRVGISIEDLKKFFKGK